MILIILPIIFFVVTLIYRIVEWGFDLEEVMYSMLMGFLGLLVAFIVGLVAWGTFDAMPDEDKIIEEHWQTELVALKDSYQIEGSAFLFSSIVNEELKYTYIYETDMGMTTGTVDADDTYIKYVGADETPYIQKWEYRPKSDFINWLFVPGSYHYTICLPEGSVIENVYEIDLE